MSVTILDIAKKTGISVSTVSRVLNKKTADFRISKDTEALVLKTAKELNYQPNQLARGLRLKKTQTIGLVAPDLSNPFFAYVIKSVQTVAHRLGYSLIVCDTDESLAMEIEHLNLLRSKGVDGLIIMPVGQQDHHLAALLQDGLAMVLLDRCFDELNADAVMIDNYQGAFEATEHLIRNGHSRIAIIKGLEGTFTNKGRVQGYKDALIRHGLAVDEGLIAGRDFGRENGYLETKLFLKMAPPPTAIFAASDLITLGALQAIFETGWRIPEDISLVAFDDMDFAPFVRSPLTAVAQPKEVMGEIAVQLLVRQINEKRNREANRIVLKPRLIVRESVRSITNAGRAKAGAA